MNWTREEATGRWQANLDGVDLRFGAGRRQEAGLLATELGITRPLLVTDPGVRAAGWAPAIADSLEEAARRVAVFDQVSENPTDRDVARGVEAAASHDADGLVAVGGGSAMDCAKAINMVHAGGGTIADYRGRRGDGRQLLPSLGVPTTAGTGSEAQSYALISDAESGEKMPCGDPSAKFRAVVLDPELPRTAPSAVAATSGLDALSHAVESFVSRRRTATSAEHALAAWRLLDTALESVLAGAANGQTWAEMQLGAYLAGAAIEGSMLGAAHAAANPLTARNAVTHGAAVMLMLPPVVRFNGASCEPLYRQLWDREADAAEGLADRLERLRTAARMPSSLREAGVPRALLGELARSAAEQWTAGFNPRPVGVEEFRSLYETAY